MSLARADEFPTEFPPRRSRCSLLFRPKDFLSEWRMDEIATLLDRAHARASASDIRASFILLVGPAVIWPATLKF